METGVSTMSADIAYIFSFHLWSNEARNWPEIYAAICAGNDSLIWYWLRRKWTNSSFCKLLSLRWGLYFIQTLLPFFSYGFSKLWIVSVSLGSVSGNVQKICNAKKLHFQMPAYHEYYRVKNCFWPSICVTKHMKNYWR